MRAAPCLSYDPDGGAVRRVGISPLREPLVRRRTLPVRLGAPEVARGLDRDRSQGGGLEFALGERKNCAPFFTGNAPDLERMPLVLQPRPTPHGSGIEQL